MTVFRKNMLEIKDLARRLQTNRSLTIPGADWRFAPFPYRHGLALEKRKEHSA